MIEGHLPNGSDAIRDRLQPQVGAAMEGVRADMGQPRRQQNTLDPIPVFVPGCIFILIPIEVPHGSAAGDGQGAGGFVEGPVEIVAALTVNDGDFKGGSIVLIGYGQRLGADNRRIEPGDRQ